jgi:uncharacterized protein
VRPSEAILAYRSDIRRVVERHRARNARVFGSAARGEDTEGSDLDLLVDPLPGATLLDLGAMQADLQERLGIPVDVLTPGDLPRKYRERVLADAVPL